MIKPVSFLGVDNKCNLKNTKTEAKENTFQRESLSLSNSQVGQAILARNNISFRNLSQPIEITDRYNKPVPGKDHLDLPNIHVYEFPDTNLQVILNTDNSIKTNDKNFPEQPQILMKISSSLVNDSNNCLEKDMIKRIMTEKLKNNSNFLLLDESFDNDTFISYSEWGGENVIKNLHNLNNIVFNLEFDDKDFYNAKAYLRNEYDEKSLENITKDKLSSYYENLKKSFSTQAFITVSDEYFKNNNNIIFSELNKGIGIKCQKVGETNKDELEKEILKSFSIGILNSYTQFGKEFFISQDNSIPQDFRIFSKNDFDKEKYFNILNQIMNEDMDGILPNNKTIFCQEISDILTKDNLPIIKNLTLAKYGTDLSVIEEVINNISEQDVKDYIKENFIEHLPKVKAD